MTPKGPDRAAARRGWKGRPVGALVRECPKCGAAPGNRCTRWLAGPGYEVSLVTTHPERGRTAEEIVTDLVAEGWTYEREEPMNERERDWWAERPELRGGGHEHPGPQ